MTAEDEMTILDDFDHSILSPSGRVSSRARAAMLKRESLRLFGPNGLQRPEPKQPSEREKLEYRLRDVRGWYRDGKGMHPRLFKREIAELEAKLAALDHAAPAVG